MDSVAVHEIRGKLNTLESLGLVAAGSKRRVKRDMPLYTRETESGQVFVAEVNEQLFQSGIKNDLCGNQCEYFRPPRVLT
jgi:recombinational DNA repair ATPase RecF